MAVVDGRRKLRGAGYQVKGGADATRRHNSAVVEAASDAVESERLTRGSGAADQTSIPSWAVLTMAGGAACGYMAYFVELMRLIGLI